MIDDSEMARRSVMGFAEMMATLARWGEGEEAVVRRPNAVGARVAAAPDKPLFSGAVVPPGMSPPEDDDDLPGCIWTVEPAAPGRVEARWFALPCLGVDLAELESPPERETPAVESAPLEAIGEVNVQAYRTTAGGLFSQMVRKIRDERARAYGLKVDGEFVCVALTLSVGDDLGIHYVATAPPHRRRGLASGLIHALLVDAGREGMRTATLQASPTGLPVYERLGFRRLARLRAYLRAAAPEVKP